MVQQILSSFGVMISQGCEEVIRSWSMRILLYTSLIFGFLFLQVLSARLSSFIAVEIVSQKITSIKDIYDQKLELYVQQSSATADSFKFSETDSYESKIWTEQISKNPNEYLGKNRDIIKERFLKNPKGVILTGNNYYKSWLKQNPSQFCNMEILKRDMTVHYAFAFRKDFPFLDMFNYFLLKYDESGLINKLKRNWLHPLELEHSYLCARNEDLPVISFQSIFELYGILGFGVVLCILLFVFEMIKKSIKIT